MCFGWILSIFGCGGEVQPGEMSEDEALTIELVAAAASGRQIEIHIQMDGDDAWNGLSAEKQTGSRRGPVRTLTRARNLARSYRKGSNNSVPIHIVIHPGFYTIHEREAPSDPSFGPFELHPIDSGTAKAPLVIRGLPGMANSTILSAGQVLRGWSRLSAADPNIDRILPNQEIRRNIVVADCEDCRPQNMRQLWGQGEAKQAARHPNTSHLHQGVRYPGYFKIGNTPTIPDDEIVETVREKAPWGAGQKQFRFYPKDILSERAEAVYGVPSISKWKKFGHVDAVVFHRWSASRLPLTAKQDFADALIDSTSYSFSRMSQWRLDADAAESANDQDKSYYFFENALEALDEPGEFYADFDTKRFYYYLKEGELRDAGGLSSFQMTVPRHGQALVLRGTREDPVQHVHVRDLSIRHASWSMHRVTPPVGEKSSSERTSLWLSLNHLPAATKPVGGQNGDFPAPGAIQVFRGVGLRLNNINVSLSSGSGISVQGRGSRDIEIRNSDFRQLGAGALTVHQRSELTTERDKLFRRMEQTQDIHFIGNDVRDVAKYHYGAKAVSMSNVKNSSVVDNNISKVLAGAIDFHDLNPDGHLVENKLGREELIRDTSSNNLIDLNRISDIGSIDETVYLNDKGGIHSIGKMPNLVISRNIIHDVRAVGVWNFGIYVDQFNEDVVVRGNTVRNTQTAFSAHNVQGRVSFLGNQSTSQTALGLHLSAPQACSGELRIVVEGNRFQTRSNVALTGATCLAENGLLENARGWRNVFDFRPAELSRRNVFEPINHDCSGLLFRVDDREGGGSLNFLNFVSWRQEATLTDDDSMALCRKPND
jgi:hypothetical protein